MKLFRQYILALLLLLIPTVSLWGASRRKPAGQSKKTKKVAAKKPPRNQTSKGMRVSKRAQSRLNKRSSAAYRAQALARQQELREQAEERRQRLYLGIDIKGVPVPGPRPSSIPILHRFLHSDSTLTQSEVRYLYRNTSRADLISAAQKESRIDYLISQEKFDEALTFTLSALRLLPTHLGLLHRSSTLAHHLDKQELLGKQIWKMAELMSCISYSGDGKSFDTAYEVLTKADAEAFETLWLDVPAESLRSRVVESGDKDRSSIVAISHRDPASKKEVTRYYKLPLQATNKKTTYNEYSVDRLRPNDRAGGDGSVPVSRAGANRTNSSPAR